MGSEQYAAFKSSDETGELILFGGAVMCLVFGSRGYTRDINGKRA